jgi:hypothetical protein
VLTPAEARADEAPVGLSLSIERVAGIAYASLRPSSSDTSLGATTFGIAGPAINPIALPRLGIDDHVFAASGSTTQQSNGSSTSSDAQVQGKYLGGQLWFGLGGYVL